MSPKILSCGVVFPGCEAQVEAETEEEVLEQARRHVRDEHGVQELDGERQAAMQAAIRQA